jgi:hypothetical protein
MLWSTLSPTELGRVALTYTGLAILPDVAGAIGRGISSTIDAIAPTSSSASKYNNPDHLGRNIDTRA